MPRGYPKVQIKDDAMAKFERAPVKRCDIQIVPGIGQANARALRRGEDSITTAYQLIRKFLTFCKGGEATTDELKAFREWLKSRGVNAYQTCISLAIQRKVLLMKPIKKSKDTRYNPSTIRTYEATMAAFRNKTIYVSLQEVPGIGKANAEALADGEDAIETVYQLIGKYLSFKGNGVTTAEQCNAFYKWLEAKGVNACRSDITSAISQKTSMLFPEA